MKEAIFFNRDGVVNELVYYGDHGIIDSPFTAKQFRLLPDVAHNMRLLREAGYVLALVSNQPGIAKGHMSMTAFTETRQKMQGELEDAGTSFDAEYYCFPHPDAQADEFKVACDCRKPVPGCCSAPPAR